MPKIPELVIPVRLDTAATGKALAKLGSEGKHAGDQVAQGMKGAQGAAGGLNDQLASLIKAQLGIAAIKAAAGAMGDEFSRAAKYTQKLAENFTDLQKKMQSVASLSGKPNTPEFTLTEARGAAQANVTPEQYRNFRDAFLSKASTYIGNGPEAKMSEADAEKFQQRLAEYAQQKGVSQEEMANFGGGLLAQQKGKTTADEMLAKAGKTFATLEASSAPVAHLLPGMTRVMAQGMSAEEAAPALAQMPEIAPEEESTHLIRVMAELRRNNLEGKGEELGIKKGMTPKEMLDATIANLRQRSGGNQDKLDELLKEFSHEDIAQNTMRGLVNQGPEATAKWKKIVEETPENKIETTLKEGRKLEVNQRFAAEAQQAAAEAERGAINSPAELERLKAKTELTKSGVLEQGRVENVVRGAIGDLTGADSEQQLVNERALFNLRMERRKLHVAEGGNPDEVTSPFNDRTTVFRSQQSVNDEIKELLREIAASNKRIAESNANMAAPALVGAAPLAAFPPLVIPAAAPRTR